MARKSDNPRCIDAAYTGNGQAYKAQCRKLWQGIRRYYFGAISRGTINHGTISIGTAGQVP
ncbi:hypothetical protein B7R74_20005 [Yersinia pseudotuberculosis]|nr:hypothetical protein B7R74_20005 [Yersinia pseudotuberculosis]